LSRNLQPDGHAVQRATVEAGDELALGYLGLRHRTVGRDVGVGAQPVVVRGDPLQ